MSRTYSPRKEMLPGTLLTSISPHLLDAIDELYDLINIHNKPFLLQNDFIDFFESKDFPTGMETFDTSKYFNFVGGNPGRVTR